MVQLEALQELIEWRGNPEETAQRCLRVAQEEGNTFQALLNLVALAGMTLLSTSIALDAPQVVEPLREAKHLMEEDGGTWTGTERLVARHHVDALEKWCQSDMYGAAESWEEVLLLDPLDTMALKFAHDAYFYLGHCRQIRDSIARVLPKWKPPSPSYSFLLGMYSFGLEECGDYEKAEEMATRALEGSSSDVWAIHTMAHIFEMKGQVDQGLEFLTARLEDWRKADFLACHLFWHMCLFHLENQDAEEVFNIWEKELSVRVKSGMPLDLVDCCSLLMRLEMEGFTLESAWKDLLELWRPQIRNHTLGFNDTHIAMAAIRVGDQAALQELFDSLPEEQIASLPRLNQKRLIFDLAFPVCRAIQCFVEDDYDAAVALLRPIRYDLYLLGGSHAQRDVYHLILLHASMQNPSNKNLARALVAERLALKQSPMNNRLQSMQLMMGLPHSPSKRGLRKK